MSDEGRKRARESESSESESESFEEIREDAENFGRMWDSMTKIQKQEISGAIQTAFRYHVDKDHKIRFLSDWIDEIMGSNYIEWYSAAKDKYIG